MSLKREGTGCLRRAGGSAWHTSSRKRGSPSKPKTCLCPTLWSMLASGSGETKIKYCVTAQKSPVESFFSHVAYVFSGETLKCDYTRSHSVFCISF